MVSWLYYMGPEVRLNILAAECRTVHLRADKKQRGTGKGQGQNAVPKDMCPVTYSLQLSLTP
jgi:hypothetical protein